MRKRILAIFLCLILTVSLATAVAAEYTFEIQPGGIDPMPNVVPNNPGQPEPDDTPVPNDTTITLQIPITKVVALGGNTAPKQTTFSFYAFPSDPSYGRYEAGGTGLWDVQNCTVSVNGAGTFGCVMTIQIDRSDFFALTDNQGIFVVETNDEQSGWTYDETRWFLQPHGNTSGRAAGIATTNLKLWKAACMSTRTMRRAGLALSIFTPRTPHR